MSIEQEEKKSKIKKFWLKYEKNVVILVGLILAIAISFEGGYLQGKKHKQEITINKIDTPGNSEKNNAEADTNPEKSGNVKNTTEKNIQITEKKDCMFVASKNSNKYHLSTCQMAQKIKPENRICFSSKEEAEGKGYIGAKCCIK